jgi:hypothetical protein
MKCLGWQIEENAEEKRILVEHGNGFLGLLLSPILESLAELV